MNVTPNLRPGRTSLIPAGLVLVAIFCFLPLKTLGNPVVLNPTSLLAFWVVAFWAAVVEAGIVALLLAFRGLVATRTFVVYSLANLAIFLFLFLPLLHQRWPLPLLEGIVVLLDGLAIKLLAGLGPFQSERCSGVSWLYALIVSFAGNAASYFVGLVLNQKPWEPK
jgi:hypothetical protein